MTRGPRTAPHTYVRGLAGLALLRNVCARVLLPLYYYEDIPYNSFTKSRTSWRVEMQAQLLAQSSLYGCTVSGGDGGSWGHTATEASHRSEQSVMVGVAAVAAAYTGA